MYLSDVGENNDDCEGAITASTECSLINLTASLTHSLRHTLNKYETTGCMAGGCSKCTFLTAP